MRPRSKPAAPPARGAVARYIVATRAMASARATYQATALLVLDLRETLTPEQLAEAMALLGTRRGGAPPMIPKRQ